MAIFYFVYGKLLPFFWPIYSKRAVGVYGGKIPGRLGQARHTYIPERWLYHRPHSRFEKCLLVDADEDTLRRIRHFTIQVIGIPILRILHLTGCQSNLPGLLLSISVNNKQQATIITYNIAGGGYGPRWPDHGTVSRIRHHISGVTHTPKVICLSVESQTVMLGKTVQMLMLDWVKGSGTQGKTFYQQHGQ